MASLSSELQSLVSAVPASPAAQSMAQNLTAQVSALEKSHSMLVFGLAAYAGYTLVAGTVAKIVPLAILGGLGYRALTEKAG